MLAERTDVLVVGAGPAGCALGHLLKSEGVDVTIAEIRDTRTKDKLCGGIYANAVAGLLDECFVRALPVPWPPTIRAKPST